MVDGNLAGERAGPAGEGSDRGPGAWFAGRTGKFGKQPGRFCGRTGRFCKQSPKNSGQSGLESGQRGSPGGQSGWFSCFLRRAVGEMVFGTGAAIRGSSV